MNLAHRTSVAPGCPLVLGALTARIEATGGEYAYLDNQGRYHESLLT